MVREIPDWVRVGAELVERTSGYYGERYGKRAKIAKVHANGNFKVEGSDQQWRPFSGGQASQTGQSGYGERMSMVLVTPELEGTIAHNRKFREAQDVVSKEAKRLEGLARLRIGFDDNAVITAAEAITARHTP